MRSQKLGTNMGHQGVLLCLSQGLITSHEDQQEEVWEGSFFWCSPETNREAAKILTLKFHCALSLILWCLIWLLSDFQKNCAL